MSSAGERGDWNGFRETWWDLCKEEEDGIRVDTFKELGKPYLLVLAAVYVAKVSIIRRGLALARRRASFDRNWLDNDNSFRTKADLRTEKMNWEIPNNVA